MKEIGLTGDGMAESRGGKEEMRLKRSYERVFKEGTEYVNFQEFEKYLTSRQLKVKQKNNNIAGLQIADLVAHPSFKATLARKKGRSFQKTLVEKLPIFWKGRSIIAVHQGRLMDGEENGFLRAKEKALSGPEGHIRPSTSAVTD